MEPIERVKSLLEHQNLSGSELARVTGLSQPTVSRALKNCPWLKLA
ncbi:ArsR family transcriptional regulator [Thiomicrorhabdus aquaedulcis]